MAREQPKKPRSFEQLEKRDHLMGGRCNGGRVRARPQRSCSLVEGEEKYKDKNNGGGELGGERDPPRKKNGSAPTEPRICPYKPILPEMRRPP